MSTLIGYARVQATISYVCEAFGVTRNQLLSRRRTRILSLARQTAMAIAYEESCMSFHDLAPIFRRDHCTIDYAVRTVRDERSVHPKFYDALVREIKEKVANEKFG